MNLNIVGWDIGGAHLKAVVINGITGHIGAVFLEPCPLWKGLVELHNAVNKVSQALYPLPIHHHAITMTGELVDLFADRDDGIQHIIDTMCQLLVNGELHIFAGINRFVAPVQAHQYYAAIASANWLASALLTAHHVGDGLFVDIGSTTTDILLLNNYGVNALGYSDYQRLISCELIYTGIIRTAVMAVTRSAQDEGHTLGVMAEYFATMADVYRITGELNENHDHTDTADNAEKTLYASAKRLARMIGCDFIPNELPRWQRFADNIREQQLQHIQQGCQVQLQRYPSPKKPIPLIGAGIGRFLVKQIALNLSHPYIDFCELFPPTIAEINLNPADCAPAVAVAYLLRSCLR